MSKFLKENHEKFCVFTLSPSLSLLLGGCGNSTNITPKISSFAVQHEIYALPANTQKYMLKYLPSNLKIGGKIKFTYAFSYLDQSSSTSLDAINLFNPLILVGFPMSNDKFSMIGNLRFFDEMHKINFSCVCISASTRNLFNNTDMTELRGECIKKIRENLAAQINQSYEKGEFDVFEK